MHSLLPELSHVSSHPLPWTGKHTCILLLYSDLLQGEYPYLFPKLANQTWNSYSQNNLDVKMDLEIIAIWDRQHVFIFCFWYLITDQLIHFLTFDNRQLWLLILWIFSSLLKLVVVGFATIVFSLKNLPKRNRHPTFLYILHVFKCLWNW